MWRRRLVTIKPTQLTTPRPTGARPVDDVDDEECRDAYTSPLKRVTITVKARAAAANVYRRFPVAMVRERALKNVGMGVGV